MSMLLLFIKRFDEEEEREGKKKSKRGLLWAAPLLFWEGCRYTFSLL